MTDFFQPLGELHTLIAADGTAMTFAPEDKEVQFVVYGNYGAPPTDFVTRQGYRQDGASEIYYYLQSRKISIEIHRTASVDRKKYWQNRNDFHELLRPNRGGPLTLTLITAGNKKRSLIVRADPGLVFPPPDINDNSFGITETLDLTAFNPIWFDPALSTVVFTSAQGNQLVFPATFPIQFSASQLICSATVMYIGTWRAYPEITLAGPFTSAILVNMTTGVYIYLNGIVLAGDSRIITLTPGDLSIVDAAGNNHFSDLGVLSNLVDWNLRPVGEVVNGANVLQAQFTGGTLGVTGGTLRYNNQYFAL